MNDYNEDELQFLIQAAQAAQIQGRHATLVAGVIDKLEQQLLALEVSDGDAD